MNKVVLVPPAFKIAGDQIATTTSVASLNPRRPGDEYVIVDSVVYPVLKNSPSNSNFFMYDPMRDYMKWYTGFEYSSIPHTLLSHLSVDQKLWNHAELHEWLDKNAKAYVLVQNSSSGWELHFTEADDSNLFSEWWGGIKKQHEMVIRPDARESSLHACENQIKQWCVTTLKSKWQLKRSYDHLTLYVFDSEEAVLAKLTHNGQSE